MFKKRMSSQKPGDELLDNFKATFPRLNVGANGTALGGNGDLQGATISDALDVASTRHYAAEQHNIKDSDPTPRASEPWTFTTTGLTPSVLDPNSHAFNLFANQLPGYYTPTPGGTNTLFHPQAGDLHTPGMLGLGTPLSMPTSDNAFHSTHQHNPMHSFSMHSSHMGPPQYGHVNPFQMHQNQSFAPHSFQQQLFEHMETQPSDSPLANMSIDVDMQNEVADMALSQTMAGTRLAPSQHLSMEKFRYHVTLNAPTAMIKHSDEIPITYLNKGQAYTINVVDSAPQQSTVGQLKYRTFVRVSFEEESQRQRPGSCWQLWKEGRGTSEAHQRGGRLQAVEYVDQPQSDDPNRAKVELESASFDGFCVTWSPGANGSNECPISVRFNFLSTDFSHSKGVKGIPVRLCSKTELLLDSMSPAQDPSHEVCYCKVKLFRDHGAERKLSNDVAHVKKMIEKLNQQISHVEAGVRDVCKKKRSGSISKAAAIQKPGKVPKHRRTWSMSSNASSGAGRTSSEEELHTKLLTLQDMFGSTRPISVFFLRGDPEDDPDLHPVQLPGELLQAPKAETTDGWTVERQNSIQTAASSAVVSPTPSTQSLASGSHGSSFAKPTAFGPPSRVGSNEWPSTSQMQIVDLQSSNPQHLASPPDQPVKVQASTPDSGSLSGWIETLGVDPSYQPPLERINKPVACFYIKPRFAGKPTEEKLYRAVYLMERTRNAFVNAVATKCAIDPARVADTVRINKNGIHIYVDDETIQEMAEGQDMTVEISEHHPTTTPQFSRDWDAGPTDSQFDDETSMSASSGSAGYELKLLY